MLKNTLYFFLIFLLNLKLMASDKASVTFINQLSKWKIDYPSLSSNKAGAACLPLKGNTYEALGLSYQLADEVYAKKIAIDGCEQMKKKKKILSGCKCEIIFVNDKFLGDK